MYYNSCENNALDVEPGGNAICINDSTSFLNFDTAFTRLINESVNLKDNATCIIPNDLSIGDKTDAYELQQDNIYEPVFLYLYFPDGSHNISIPYEIFQKLNISNIVINGVSLADVTNDEYVISITGINDSDISLDFNGAQPNSGIIGVRTTGNIGFAQALKSSESSGQICSSGMKFIWNFPDATGTINLDTQSGHIVAPQAHIVENEKCGNFEGNVIADSVDFNGAEAHFYPYNAINPNGFTPASVEPSAATTVTTPASTAPASTTPASTTPASTTPATDPASTAPASTAPASTTPASTTPATDPTSTTPASTTPASTTPATDPTSTTPVTALASTTSASTTPVTAPAATVTTPVSMSPSITPSTAPSVAPSTAPATTPAASGNNNTNSANNSNNNNNSSNNNTNSNNTSSQTPAASTTVTPPPASNANPSGLEIEVTTPRLAASNGSAADSSAITTTASQNTVVTSTTVTTSAQTGESTTIFWLLSAFVLFSGVACLISFVHGKHKV